MATLNSQRLTFLELCNRVLRITGQHGYEEKGGLDEFTEQLAIIPLYVESAWNEIARARSDWRFLRRDNVTTNKLRPFEYEQRVEELLGDKYVEFSHWNEAGQFHIIEGDLTFTFSSLFPYEDIRYLTPDNIQPGNTVYISLMPNMNVYVWPAPAENNNTKLRVDYYKRPAQLREDNDTTDLPPGLENVVIHRALMMYAAGQEDKFHRIHHEVNYRAAKSNLEGTEAPRIKTYIPLIV